ncbi:MAG: DUF4382 domain-containing protein [Thermoplasmata archaeon]|jgi:hypothetical protein|nr:DUF4382 domain-containing protein [Thermoplasmata archaeon]
MTNIKTVLMALAVASIVAVASASAYIVLRGESDTGTIRVFVKDAPEGWSHVNVTFSRVEIHQADEDEDGNDSGWHNVTIVEGTIDLIPLTNMSKLLAEHEVPVGKYTQIRIYVLTAVGVMADGTQVNFTVPSGVLKTNHPFNITSKDSTSLTVDIDLSKSIVNNGDEWKFTPVMGAIFET